MIPFNWNVFPFTKMNAINLDWLMAKFKELTDKTDSVDQAVIDANAAADRAEAAAGTITGAVLYDQPQTLTGPEQTQARANIAAAAAADATPDAVLYDHAQTLTNTQMSQARANINAASTADAAGTVKYTAQTLSAAQQAQARANIGAATSAQSINAVLYDQAQALNATEQAQARSNIDAAATGDVPASPVLYGEAQTLSSAEQAQARSNIDAAATGDVPTGPVVYDAAQTLTAAEEQQARENIGIDSYKDPNFTASGVTTITNQGSSYLSVTEHSIEYKANTDRTIIQIQGYIAIQMSSSAVDQKIVLNDIIAPAQAATRKYDLIGFSIRATSAISNHAINTTAMTRIYPGTGAIEVATDGTISILVGNTASSSAGNYITYFIPPTLLLL